MFKPYTKMETVSTGLIDSGTGTAISGSRRVEKTIQPYENELAQAEDILNKETAYLNSQRSPSDQLPAPTKEQIQNKAKQIIGADMTYKM